MDKHFYNSLERMTKKYLIKYIINTKKKQKDNDTHFKEKISILEDQLIIQKDRISELLTENIKFKSSYIENLKG